MIIWQRIGRKMLACREGVKSRLYCHEFIEQSDSVRINVRIGKNKNVHRREWSHAEKIQCHR